MNPDQLPPVEERTQSIRGNDAFDYPDIELSLQVRRAVINATENRTAFDTDDAIMVLETELAFLRSQRQKTYDMTAKQPAEGRGCWGGQTAHVTACQPNCGEHVG